MTICTSITETYLNKCSRFFESVRENFTGKRICFTIGFMAVIEGWETVYVEKCEYDWKPTNRKNYASLQHGEFIKHYDFAPDEMICFMDADMILQRKWDITFPPTKGVLVTQCSWPRQRLGQVARNLRCKRMEPICRDAICGEPICRDAICRDAICREPICGDAICRDAICRELICRELICGDAICRDAICGDAICRDAICGEPICRDAICGEPICREYK